MNGERLGALVEVYYDPQKRICEVLTEKGGSSLDENSEQENPDLEKLTVEPEAATKEMLPIEDLVPTVRGS